MFCPKCGTDVAEEVKCCPKCGEKLQSNKSKKKKILFSVLGVICVVLLSFMIMGDASDTNDTYGKYAGDSEDGKWYIHTDTIEYLSEGTMLKVGLTVVTNEIGRKTMASQLGIEEDVYRAEITYLIDINERKMATKRLIAMRENGSVITETDIEEDAWMSFGHGSVVDMVMEECKKLKK